MKNKLGVLFTLAALVILVGAGCAKTDSPTVDDQKQSESSENQAVKTEVENSETVKTETEDSNENEVENEVESEDDDKPATAVKPTTPTKPATTVTPVDTGKTALTIGEVAKHNSQSDCYIIVRDSVYDVTKFIPNHPGGPGKIVPLCGKDATSAFTGQHDGQPQPEAALASFKIGALQK